MYEGDKDRVDVGLFGEPGLCEAGGAGDGDEGDEREEGDGGNADEEKGEEEAREVRFSNIVQSGGVTVSRDGITLHTLLIAGQVEGHYLLPGGTKTTKYEHVIPSLVSVEEDPHIDGLLVLLNTVGGDVEAGLAVAELIAGMRKPTVSLVLGGGHSIGVPLAVCAKKSFIVPSATMTLHPVRMNGLVIGAPQTYAYFRDMQERIVDFIVGHSRVEREVLSGLMLATDALATDMGTIIDGRRAVEIGLIDEVGTFAGAIAACREMVRAFRA